MPVLPSDQLTILQQVLAADYVPHLPPLLDTSPSAEQQSRKNLSRAFSAFAIRKLCDLPCKEAAQAVVDDFDDYGLDAIYYHAKTETLYLVQSKLKASEQFSQEEALAFCQGIRKLIKQDFAPFNQNVKNRQLEIEGALENCSHIRLVVAHTGAGISHHAKHAIDEILNDEDHGEERLVKAIADFDSACVIDALSAAKAYERVDADIHLSKATLVSEPKATYFGLADLKELVHLHQRHGPALYEKNIRTFLGHKTDVNASIRKTLIDNPAEFLYLNNGVAALCQHIAPKGSSQAAGGKKKLRIKGLSIINGAQTIASAAALVASDKTVDISAARVTLTLIEASTDGDFGKSVTRARNHQNPVFHTDFVALDGQQERLRRELAHLGFDYAYKPGVGDQVANPKRIGLEEATQALALFSNDPRFAVWLKKEPARLLDTSGEPYATLFHTSLTAFQLANAVFLLRYVQQRMSEEARAATGIERLAYKHGNHALGWILAKRLYSVQQGVKLIEGEKLKSKLSGPLDGLRVTLWGEVLKEIKGPLALFRNQADALPLIERSAIKHYELTEDPVVERKRKQQKGGQPYPQELFDYVANKAPQISDLT
jgi:hypothetical protein